MGNITTKLRTGDEVVVLAGRDVGKTGTLRKIFKSKNKAIVIINRSIQFSHMEYKYKSER